MLEYFDVEKESRTSLIAEIGINHGGDPSLAWEMILSAAKNGADYVKLQTFVLEDFFHSSLGYYSEFKKLELSLDEQAHLFQKAKQQNIPLLTTAFDSISLELADSFDPPAYKIASMDNDNPELIRSIARKKKPVLISLGMAGLKEAKKAIEIMQEEGNPYSIFLHCVSDYPTQAKDSNLSMIGFLKKELNFPVGLSDHSIGLSSSYIGMSLGACIIEKHFTLDRSWQEDKKRFPISDHAISIEPHELRTLRNFLEEGSKMIGKAPRNLTQNETLTKLQTKRGIYARRLIQKGEVLNLENCIFLRPIKKIPAFDWNKIKDQNVVRNIPKHSPISYEDLLLQI